MTAANPNDANPIDIPVAPTGKLILARTTIALVVMGVAVAVGVVLITLDLAFLGAFVLALIVLVLLACWAGRVVGYRLSADMLEIRRPFTIGQVPLATITAVRPAPQALDRALRVFGNGGLFALTGLYKTRDHGVVRVYATDPTQLLLLERAQGRAILLSPADPAGAAALIVTRVPALSD